LYLSPYSFNALPLVNNDGLHSARDRDSTITLTAGVYPIAISYFNKSAGKSITVSWKTPQTANLFTSIPDSVFTDFIPGVPLIIAPDKIGARVGETRIVDFSASTQAGEQIVFSAQGLPAFTKLTDNKNGTGKLTITPVNGDEGNYSFLLIATDKQGNKGSFPVALIVTKDGQYVFVNLNSDPVTNANSPYNNLAASPIAGKSIALVDDFGEPSGINMTLQESWVSKAFTDGGTTYNNTGFFSDQAMEVGIAEYNAISRSIRFTNLPANKKFTFYFYSSRLFQGGKRNIDFVINGKTVSINANDNKENIVQLNELEADSNNEILLTINRGQENTSAIFLNAIAINIYAKSSKPGTPTKLISRTETRSSIKLTWIDNADGETGYEVYRSTRNKLNFIKIADLPSNTVSYSDTGLISNTLYFYQVASKRQTELSEFSNIDSAVTTKFAIYINFNNQNPEKAPWYNTNGIPQVGRVWTLQDELGTVLGVQMKVLNGGFSGVNPNGANTLNNSGVYPDNVMRSSFWVDGGNQANLLFTGLDTSLLYNLTFFASRAEITGKRLTEFVVNGESIAILDAANNSTTTCSLFSIKPNATGAISLVVKAGLNSSFGYINALVIQAIPKIASVPDPVKPDTPIVVPPVIYKSDTLTAYPNPFTSNIILKLTIRKPLDGPILSLYNFNSVLVYQKRLGNLPAGPNLVSLKLDQLALPNGMYVIKIIDNNSFSIFTKVLKQ
jgi:hypothetical protein